MLPKKVEEILNVQINKEDYSEDIFDRENYICASDIFINR